jgi:uncharacterized protein (TIGR02453 family)
MGTVSSVAGSDAATTFRGFPPEAVDFYRQLTANNTKAFWTEHRDTYDRAVREPLEALAAELEPEYGTFHLFRPHRDVRFSKDKSPYKDHQGAVTEGQDGELYYLHISEEGLFVASGYHYLAPDQLERYRQAVVDDDAGPELEQIVAKLEKRYEIGGHALKTAPRGYPRDHPRVRLLQHKGMTAGRRLGAPAWLATRQAKKKIIDAWAGAAPLSDWLNAHVGPSELPPDEFR